MADALNLEIPVNRFAYMNSYCVVNWSDGITISYFYLILIVQVNGGRALAFMGNFVIAGERRCGTTFLYQWLRAHSEVFIVSSADINYFTEPELNVREWFDGDVDSRRWEAECGAEGYESLFQERESELVWGHKGADLLFWRPAHERMRRVNPNMKVIISLRNPVERAWSQYWNEVGKGRESLSFTEAMDAEEERCEKSAYARFHLSYVRRGFYARSLEALFQFFPREQVHILTVEESKVKPEETLRGVYDFLGVDSAFCPDRSEVGQAVNKNWTMVLRPWAKHPLVRPLERAYSRVTEAAIVRLFCDARRREMRKRVGSLFRKPAEEFHMSESERSRLVEVYRPEIEKLELLLERSFSIWKMG